MEKDQKIIDQLKLKYKHFIDLSKWEAEGLALEGKGALIFDYRNHKMYASL